MNICFLSQEYPPETHVGGIGTYTFNVASALAKLGHTVHVITSTRNTERTFQNNGVSVHKIKRRKIKLQELEHLVYSYRVAKKISWIECQFDIVQASEYANEAFWFSFDKKVPLITRLATPFFLVEKMNGKMFLGPRPFFNWMEKKQTLSSDGIFTSTTAIAKAVTEKWRIELEKVNIIPNSVDISRIIRLGANKSVPDILKNNRFLLYFGRLEERKGVRDIAQALPAVFKQFPELNVVFVGNDLGYKGSSMRDYIRKESGSFNNRVIFFDNLPHDELFPIVNSAKMVILPSVWEAFGFVCVEAMALGRPVIATSGSGFQEIIENNVSGFLVEPRNNKMLANKIIESLKDEGNLLRISEGARKRAKDFEVSAVSNQLLAYYDKVIKDWKIKKKHRVGCNKR
ncbi:MAG: glycosyltransferase family 4 protein [Thermodesulfobacteriota bacterium]|nr:glycosyltransferase family 4 protein [Thermodesulfobacteriota bacterium]